MPIDVKQTDELRRLQSAIGQFRNGFVSVAAVLDEVKARGPQNYDANQFAGYAGEDAPPPTPFGGANAVTMTQADFASLCGAMDLVIAFVQGEQRAHDAAAVDYKPIIYKCAAVNG